MSMKGLGDLFKQAQQVQQKRAAVGMNARNEPGVSG